MTGNFAASECGQFIQIPKAGLSEALKSLLRGNGWRLSGSYWVRHNTEAARTKAAIIEAMMGD